MEPSPCEYEQATDKPNYFEMNANEVMEIKLLEEKTDFEQGEVYHPTFTHQIYGLDEKIVGYDGLKLKLYFLADSLETYVEMKYTERMVIHGDFTPLERLTKKPVEWKDRSVPPLDYPIYTDVSEYLSLMDKEWKIPFQELAWEYKLNGEIFQIYHGSFKQDAVKAYHRKLQVFSLLYIDAISYLEEDDDDWEIFVTFKKRISPNGKVKYSAVSFSTCYRFYAHPHASRLRVSQFLVLPPFQRKGHGSKLLEGIYNYAKNMMDNCIEVTVEDPCEGYQGMRDMIDYELFVRWINNHSEYSSLGVNLVWSKKLGKTVQQDTKMTMNQIQRSYEVYKLFLINQMENFSMKEEEKTKFRLAVKRRIYQIYDLGLSIEDADLRKSKLHEIWEEVHQEYLNFLARYHVVQMKKKQRE